MIKQFIYAQAPEAALRAIRRWREKRTIGELRAIAGGSRAAFARAYGVPVRTLENWEAEGGEKRQAPEYVLDLLAFAVIQDIAAASEPDRYETVERRWCIIERTRGDECETILDATDRDDAYRQARLAWDKMSAYDQRQSEAYFVGLADVEDGVVNLDTMTEIMEIK